MRAKVVEYVIWAATVANLMVYRHQYSLKSLIVRLCEFERYTVPAIQPIVSATNPFQSAAKWSAHQLQLFHTYLYLTYPCDHIKLLATRNSAKAAALPHHILQHFPVSYTTYLWLFVHLHTVELQVYWAVVSQYLQAVNVGGGSTAHRRTHTLWPNAKQLKFAHTLFVLSNFH